MGQNRKLDLKLLKCLAGSNVEMPKLLRLIGQGADPLACDDKGRTLLHLMLTSRWSLDPNGRELIALCLGSGMDIDVRDATGSTPLHYAARIFHRSSGADSLKELVATYGADPNARNFAGQTPLHWAAANPDSALHGLLEAGADPRISDGDGVTPLHIAAQKGSPAQIDLLLAAGADAGAKTKALETPSDYALKANKFDRSLTLRKKRDDALRKAEQPPAEPAPLPAPEDPWKLLDPACVAFTADRGAIGYRITEIFNFSSRLYTQIARNTATGAEAMAVRPFDDFSDRAPLDLALAELRRLGGAADHKAGSGLAIDKPRKIPRQPEM